MEVRLRYFDGCPNWRATYERVLALLEERGLADVEVALERVESFEDAERLRFIGSPTILINGLDAFPSPGGSFGLTCRVYETPDGLAGSPTTDQLRRAFSDAA